MPTIERKKKLIIDLFNSAISDLIDIKDFALDIEESESDSDFNWSEFRRLMYDIINNAGQAEINYKEYLEYKET